MTWLTRLSPRDSRLLALLVTGVFLWLVYALVISPLTSTQTELNADIMAARKQLGRLEAVLARAQGTQSAVSNEAQFIWSGTSPPVIAANVQSEVQSLAQSHGVTIVSISQTQSRFSQDFQTAGLVIEGHGEIAAFVDLFTKLEHQQPILFIDKLMLRRFQSPSPSSAGARLPLAVRFEVHAPHQLEASE
ncbi:MAG: type II secretion system protein GspM [Pseudomonadota bacterium]